MLKFKLVLTMVLHKIALNGLKIYWRYANREHRNNYSLRSLSGREKKIGNIRL